ncbi:MAG: hypothetical protein QM500_04170 [Methylococcales bacterium]
MANFLSELKDRAIEKVKKDGIQIWIKTDLGSSIKVYDSDAESLPGQSSDDGAFPTLVEYGVQVRNRNGKVLKKYNEFPKTNYVKLGLITGVGFIGLLIMAKGVKGFIQDVT